MIWFKYDAEGRFLCEGNKTYRYGYLDKVLSVTDGDTTRTYTYHADGQLASASCDGIGRAGAHPALSPLRGSLRSATIIFDFFCSLSRTLPFVSFFVRGKEDEGWGEKEGRMFITCWARQKVLLSMQEALYAC